MATVDNALELQLYHRGEIPQAALFAYDLDILLGDVRNGGFDQYVHNQGYDSDRLADVARQLTQAGVAPFATALRRVVSLLDGQPKKVQRALRDGGWIDIGEGSGPDEDLELLSDLPSDDELISLDIYLLGQPGIIVAPADQGAARTQLPPHPRMKARAAKLSVRDRQAWEQRVARNAAMPDGIAID